MPKMYPQIKVHPGPYPRIPHFLLATLQLLSSATVAGVMFYFIAHLYKTGNRLPWMYYFLQGSALLTIVSAIGIRVVARFRGPVPIMGATINGVLSALWAAGLGLLIDAMQDTIATPCTETYWGRNGITICALYKALAAGAALGLLSTIGLTILHALASKKLTHQRRRVSDRAGLLPKSVPGSAEYMPVWAGQSHAGPGLEPTRDEHTAYGGHHH